MNDSVNAPKWFSVIAIIALVWNILGLLAFAMQMMMTPQMMAELPEAQQELYRTQPGWLNPAFAGSVIAGTLGALGLVLKKGWALPLLIISFVCLLAQQYYMHFMSNMFEVMGSGAMVLPMLVLAIAAFLIWQALHGRSRQWLT